MPERVRITDVAPRDGLQNEPVPEGGSPIATSAKLDLIDALARTGADEIEITSFVSPRAIPQLGDAPELCARLAQALADQHDPTPTHTLFSALVPNERGMQALLDANDKARAHGLDRPLVGKVSVFTAASESFNQKNTRATIAESIERFKPIVSHARDSGLALRGYVSCAIACPYEGAVTPDAVVRVGSSLRALGINEIDLGDTIGAGTPETIGSLLDACIKELGPPGDADHPALTLHLHDTHGRAVSCVHAALGLGVRSFDGAAGGLGGCPFASTASMRAPGNIDNAALTAAIEDAGYATRVDRDALAAASAVALSMRTRGGED